MRVYAKSLVVGLCAAAVVIGVCWKAAGLRADDGTPGQVPLCKDAGKASPFASYVDGRRWDPIVTPKDIDESPEWNDTAVDPPLSIAAAVKAARLLPLNLLPNTTADQWQIKSLDLQ